MTDAQKQGLIGALWWKRLPWGRDEYVSLDANAAHAAADLVLEAGYRKPRTITTAEDLAQLYALDIVLYDDTANGGLLKAYVVPDDGTVMLNTGDPQEFHLQDFNGEYVYAEDMPLPVTVIREAP